MPVQLQYIHLIKDKTNAPDPSSDVFAILISFTQTKNTNSLLFHIFCQKLTNSDVTKKH